MIPGKGMGRNWTYRAWAGEGQVKKPRAVMGWKGVRIWDKGLDPVDLLAAYLKKVADESCGQCAPCRFGTARTARLSARLAKGEGTEADLEQIRRLVRHISLTARCDIGRTLAKPVLDLMDQFSQAFTEAAQGKRTAATPGTYAAMVTAPCIQACPAHVDIPAYLENVRMERFSQAMDTVRQGCPMPGTIGRVWCPALRIRMPKGQTGRPPLRPCGEAVFKRS